MTFRRWLFAYVMMFAFAGASLLKAGEVWWDLLYDRSAIEHMPAIALLLLGYLLCTFIVMRAPKRDEYHDMLIDKIVERLEDLIERIDGRRVD